MCIYVCLFCMCLTLSVLGNVLSVPKPSESYITERLVDIGRVVIVDGRHRLVTERDRTTATPYANVSVNFRESR